MKLKVIATDSVQVASLLEEFKTYASVPAETDTSRDAMLTSMLRSALLRVQEYADTVLVQTLYLMTLDAADNRTFRLYPGGFVQSVTDAAGDDVAYTDNGDGTVTVKALGTVKVTYTTQEPPEDPQTPLALPGDLLEYKPTVFRYATALYDGETTEVLNGILNEALC